jgi:hypothetical protein
MQKDLNRICIFDGFVDFVTIKWAQSETKRKERKNIWPPFKMSSLYQYLDFWGLKAVYDLTLLSCLCCDMLMLVPSFAFWFENVTLRRPMLACCCTPIHLG